MLILIWIWSLVFDTHLIQIVAVYLDFDTPMIQILALYLDFQGAKNINVL